MVWVRDEREVGETGGVVRQEWMKRQRRGRGERGNGATEAEFLPPDSQRVAIRLMAFLSSVLTLTQPETCLSAHLLYFCST